MPRIPGCHPYRLHEAHGLCKPCYQEWRVNRPEQPKAKCHPTRGEYSAGMCRSCYTGAHADRAKNAERERQRRRKWSEKHEESERARFRRLHGIVDATGERKVGPCEICGVHCDPLHLDHDHGTGLMRGWLCAMCNHGLGRFRDDVSIMLKAIDYLRSKT